MKQLINDVVAFISLTLFLIMSAYSILFTMFIIVYSLYRIFT